MLTPDPSQLRRRLDLAVDAARAAGDLTLRYFRRGIDVESKSDGSPVTVADREAEQLLRRQIESTFPDDAILGEEFPERAGTSGYQWILDPIDGTKSFVGGVPLYTTLVALLYEDDAVAGVINAPAVHEVVYAGQSMGCWHVIDEDEPQPAHVSEVDDLAKATVLTTDVPAIGRLRDPAARASYDRLETSTRLSRTWGDGFGYLLVATGRAEIMIDPAMAIWDTAALLPVIEEAGGVFTDWRGQRTFRGGDAIATNGALAADVRSILCST